MTSFSQQPIISPHQRWMRLFNPAEFDQLPHLFGVATEWVDSPSYYCDSEFFEPYKELCIFQYTLEGYGFASYGGKTYKLDRGKALIFSKRVPDACFYYPPNETKPWRFIECEFSNLQDAVEQLDARYGPVYELGEESPLPKKLAALMEAHQFRNTMLSGAQSLEFCAEILREMCRIIEMKDDGEGGSVAIKARNLIYKERMREFSLDDLSKRLGICAEHLCRVYKKELNDTPKHYYDQLRVGFITERLINTRQSLKEIAAEFGFKSMPNFYAFYKKHGGKTPGEVRQNRAQMRRG